MHPIRRQDITLGHKIEEGSIENRRPLTRGGSSSPTIYGRGTINNYVEEKREKTRTAQKFQATFYRALPVADGALRPQARANWPITDEVITRTQKFSRMCLVLKPPHDRRQIKRETPRDPPLQKRLSATSPRPKIPHCSLLVSPRGGHDATADSGAIGLAERQACRRRLEGFLRDGPEAG